MKGYPIEAGRIMIITLGQEIIDTTMFTGLRKSNYCTVSWISRDTVTWSVNGNPPQLIRNTMLYAHPTSEGKGLWTTAEQFNLLNATRPSQ